MSQHTESTQLLLCFHGFYDLVSNANTDVCVLHLHKRPPSRPSERHQRHEKWWRHYHPHLRLDAWCREGGAARMGG